MARDVYPAIIMASHHAHDILGAARFGRAAIPKSLRC